MDFAFIVYDYYDAKEYHNLMYQIIELLDDQYACQTYNYRLLLREFWITSPPHLKQQVITIETGDLDIDYLPLITKLFLLKSFTDEDFAIIDLILESTNSFDRESILKNQGNSIFDTLIVPRGNYGLADLFLKSLDLNHDFLQTFKKDFIIDDFFAIMKKRSIKFVDKIFEWAAGDEEIGQLKEEVFNISKFSNKMKYLLSDSEDEISLTFLNELLKWFQKTDEEIEEWKNNGISELFDGYDKEGWFNNYLQSGGYSYLFFN